MIHCVSDGCNLGRTPRSSPQRLNWPTPCGIARFVKTLAIYIFSGSEDPVGQQLAGVSILIERYRAAGIRNVRHNFYEGGRHEMLNEINRDEVRANLLRWICEVQSEDCKPARV